MIDCKKIRTKIKSYMQIYNDLSAQMVKRTNDWLLQRLTNRQYYVLFMRIAVKTYGNMHNWRNYQPKVRKNALTTNQSTNQMRNYIVNGLYSQFNNHNIS